MSVTPVPDDGVPVVGVVGLGDGAAVVELTVLLELDGPTGVVAAAHSHQHAE